MRRVYLVTYVYEDGDASVLSVHETDTGARSFVARGYNEEDGFEWIEAQQCWLNDGGDRIWIESQKVRS